MIPGSRGFSGSGTTIRTLAVLAVVAAAGRAAAAEPLRQGKASGSFSVDGKKVTLRYAYALVQENMFDDDKKDVAVLLTSAPLGDEALRAASLDEAIDRKIPALFYAIDADGKTVREAIVHPGRPGGGDSMTGQTLGTVTLKRTGDGVQGTVEISPTGMKSQRFFQFTFAVKATFEAPLSASREVPKLSAANADPLPKDGGAPAKAYLALIAAARKGDLKAVQASVQEDMWSASPEEQRFALAMLTESVSKGLEIEKGFVKGEDATLYVVGTGADGVSYGTVRMRSRGSAWILMQQSFQDRRPGAK